MNIVRLVIFIIAVLSLIEHTVDVFGQEPEPNPNPAEQLEAGVELDDPRIVKLEEAYRLQLRKLKDQLISDVESLGTVKAPSHLELVEQQKSRWSLSLSTIGFGNHSVRITASDVEETEAWPHYLDAPPLDPRAAIATADQTMRKSFLDDATTFKLQRISLVPLVPNEGKWYWEAMYEVTRGTRKTELVIAIRMDGKILTRF